MSIVLEIPCTINVYNYTDNKICSETSADSIYSNYSKEAITYTLMESTVLMITTTGHC